MLTQMPREASYQSETTINFPWMCKCTYRFPNQPLSETNLEFTSMHQCISRNMHPYFPWWRYTSYRCANAPIAFCIRNWWRKRKMLHIPANAVAVLGLVFIEDDAKNSMDVRTHLSCSMSTYVGGDDKYRNHAPRQLLRFASCLSKPTLNITSMFERTHWVSHQPLSRMTSNIVSMSKCIYTFSRQPLLETTLNIAPPGQLNCFGTYHVCWRWR